MVTLLIPCNRDHQWLRNCFESIRANGPKNEIEVLIVLNNASTQVKTNIIKLKDEILPTAKIVDSGVGTLSDALNYGLLCASFEYIARLDSDDELCKNRIEAQVEILENSPEISAVGSFVRVISEDGVLRRVIRFPVNPDEIATTIKYGNRLAHPTVTFRKSIAQRVGMYSNNFPHAEDYELWLKMAEVSKLINAPIIGTNYRQHISQVSQSNSSEQIISTRKLAVTAISKSLAKDNINLSVLQKSQLLDSGLIRFGSKELRAEKARLEWSQFVAFRDKFTFSEKVTKITTVVLNNPNILFTWGARKARRLFEGKK